MNENEILSAQLMLKPIDPGADINKMDEELTRINQKIEKLVCNIPREGYAVAVFCGVLSGAFDSILFRNESFDLPENYKSDFQQITDILKNVDFQKLKNNQTVNYPFRKAVKPGFLQNIPGLEKLSKQATPFGVLASILIQGIQGGMISAENGQVSLFPDGVSQDDRIIFGVITVFIALLKWFSSIAQTENTRDKEQSRSKGLAHIRKLVCAAPFFSQFIHEVEKWYLQLPNEMKAHQSSDRKPMGLSQVMLSFFSMMAGMPLLKDTGFPRAVNAILESKKMGLDEIPILHSLDRQGLPVLFNEILVQTAYFVLRLSEQLTASSDLNRVEWGKVFPFGSRDLDRMVAVASMTFSTVDIADAAIRSAVESSGELIVFAIKFVPRFNLVGARRAIFAVQKDISYTKEEAKLAEERRSLKQEREAAFINRLQEYQRQLENKLSAYLAEDLMTFLDGFNDIDQGFLSDDSDLVIRGNVIIQRVLGREPQFTTQQEFDELMESDTPLQL